MTLKDYIEMIQPLKIEKSNGDFLREIFNNFIREPFANEVEEDSLDRYNPINKYYENDETLRKICNGRLPLSQACASALCALYDKDRLSGFFIQRRDDLTPFRDAIVSFGFKMNIDGNEDDIPGTCADLLYKIVEDIANGKKETFPPLQKLDIKTIGKEAFKKAYVKNNCLYIDGHPTIKLPSSYEEATYETSEKLPYILKLLELYSEKANEPITSLNELKQYSNLWSHFSRQQQSFYSAEAIKRSVRDLFVDGQENFDLLENEMYSAIAETYFDFNITDNFTRLREVLDMAVRAQLNSTVLLNIRGLITAEERKGIIHILVNDGKIKSWIQIE